MITDEFDKQKEILELLEELKNYHLKALQTYEKKDARLKELLATHHASPDTRTRRVSAIPKSPEWGHASPHATVSASGLLTYDSVKFPLTRELPRLDIRHALHTKSASAGAPASASSHSDAVCGESAVRSPNLSSISPVRASMDLSACNNNTAMYRALDMIPAINHKDSKKEDLRHVRFSSKSPQVAIFSVDRATQSEEQIPREDKLEEVSSIDVGSIQQDSIASSVSGMLDCLNALRDSLIGKLPLPHEGAAACSMTGASGFEEDDHTHSSASAAGGDACVVEQSPNHERLSVSPTPVFLQRDRLRLPSSLALPPPGLSVVAEASSAPNLADGCTPQRMSLYSWNASPKVVALPRSKALPDTPKKKPVAKKLPRATTTIPKSAMRQSAYTNSKRVRIQLPSTRNTTVFLGENATAVNPHQAVGSGAGIVLACGPKIYFN